MRLGVIDVGSNTVHLLVVDAYSGAHPLPDYSHKVVLRLAEHLTPDGDISAAGAQMLTDFVQECTEVAESRGVSELMGFATSAIRDAGNTDEVLAQVEAASGVGLQVLAGEDESRLTFLAARRWFGWSSGRLLLVDIGGGSLELAAGIDEDADVAVSLPLGAGRLTRELDGDPPTPGQLKELRKNVRAEIADVRRDIKKVGVPDRVVGSSKTIRALGRVCGAAPSGEGPYVRRTLARADLTARVPELAAMTAAERSALPGVSEARAPQVLAGAIVVESVMELFDIEELEICPWALREGVILRRLDWMSQ
ncbi:Ppx/GppA phosphatase family protein [Ornithinicoccus hortensis]|uniref:Exopolyphosphatase/guanosine-5'-triphosphate, 3'-diphosphate pyrophosphatase n=1 Tax=Ornithinicoccus hortensis TaxID=82346 RepID=A0A542YVW2_9MICO|nr:Ppx/GppA phosphatase family protein [Ornithinicoccus hortensis]TQL52215.1 exopolyphosphatase/guanosine-5'-triphosphate,3'-diphosphate pyrophosphatase [Ornithinicoccus hortensis]